ncbi:hypothetical protein IWX49DRAFT_339162 [Phyllosticta citricarpa]
MMAEPLLSVRLLIVAALVTSVAAGCQETCNAAYSDCLMSCQSNPACINPCQRNTCKIDLQSQLVLRTGQLLVPRRSRFLVGEDGRMTRPRWSERDPLTSSASFLRLSGRPREGEPS